MLNLSNPLFGLARIPIIEVRIIECVLCHNLEATYLFNFIWVKYIFFNITQLFYFMSLLKLQLAYY